MSELEMTGSYEPVTRSLFLQRLLSGISALPVERIREIEDDIRRHFDEGMASGEDELALSAKLGDPGLLAQEYVSLYQEEGIVSKEKSTPPNRRGASAKAFITVGMFFFSLCVALPVWLILGSFWLVLACGYLMAVSGVLVLLLTVVHLIYPLPWITDYPLLNIFGGIACASLGGLMAIAANAYGRLFLLWTREYRKFLARAINGRNEDE